MEDEAAIQTPNRGRLPGTPTASPVLVAVCLLLTFARPLGGAPQVFKSLHSARGRTAPVQRVAPPNAEPSEPGVALPAPRPVESVLWPEAVDAHRVAVQETVALSGVVLTREDPWDWVWRGAVLLVCSVGLYFLLRPAHGRAAERIATYVFPAELTSLSVLNLLRQMEQDERLALPPDHRAELAQCIRDLERRYFGPDAETNGQADLERLAREWLGRASLRRS